MNEHITRFLGNYSLVKLLGKGGFAEVYLGEHVHLKRLAAIKILSFQLAEEDQQGFLNEAQIIAHLKHPHIVRVLEFGMDGDSPFLVMTYAPHGTLRQLHPRGTIVPPATVAAYVKQVASALQYAHGQKLIHRDIKPENMLIGDNGEVLLSDFGIATIARSSRSQSVENVIGTLAYMAPEQLRGKPRPASDQYALAVVAYEWLCGSRPFSGATYIELANKQLTVPPRPLREKVSGLPEGVEAVIMRALAKDYHQRFESVQAFAEALERACSTALSREQVPTSSAFSQEGDQGSATTQVYEEEAVSRTGPPARHELAQGRNGVHLSRRLLLSGLAGLAVAGGAIAWFERALVGGAAGKQATSPGAHATRQSTTQSTEATTPQAGTTVFVYRKHSGPVYGVAWSPDGKRIASWGNDGTMQIWEALSGRTLATYPMQHVLGWSPNWKYVATGDTFAFQIQEAATGHIIGQYKSGASGGGVEPPNMEVCWSPNSKYIASTLAPETAMRVWETTSGQTVFLYQKAQNFAGNIAWSPNSKHLAFLAIKDRAVSAFTYQLQVYTLTGQHLYTSPDLFILSGGANSLAWSPDGTRVTVASGNDERDISICDLNRGTIAVTHQSPTGSIAFVAWSPGGKTIASIYNTGAGGTDKTVELWDVANGQTLFTYTAHTDQVNEIAWSPDGKLIASASADKTVRIWQAPQGGR